MKTMRRILFACLIAVVSMAGAVSAEPPPGSWSTMLRYLKQVAPKDAFYINTVTTSGSSDDSLYFGFVASWVSITAGTADITVSFFQDTDLRALTKADTLQYASGAGAINTIPRVDPSEFTVKAGETFNCDFAVSAARVQGTASGDARVFAGASPLWGGN